MEASSSPGADEITVLTAATLPQAYKPENQAHYRLGSEKYLNGS